LITDLVGQHLRMKVLPGSTGGTSRHGAPAGQKE
jgi:hypothetical protein